MHGGMGGYFPQVGMTGHPGGRKQLPVAPPPGHMLRQFPDVKFSCRFVQPKNASGAEAQTEHNTPNSTQSGEIYPDYGSDSYRKDSVLEGKAVRYGAEELIMKKETSSHEV